MKIRELLFGRSLRTREEKAEQLGVGCGVPALGLDALASAAYGPEAALTILLPLGALASGYIGPITVAIILLLFAVALSYIQTIPAYPNGGGSFTVTSENLGTIPGLLAASSLCIDYILNVAVAISAGVGALVSMVPSLLPHTVFLCLVILVLLTVVNLRGIRSAGLVFMAPTWLFVGSLAIVIAIGLVKIAMAHGHPTPLVALPRIPVQLQSAGLWLFLRAFASGCTALTGIEAVSNAVPVFRLPQIPLARRTLIVITVSLAILLAGVAFLSQYYAITALPPGEIGYQSVVSQIVSAVTGRGVFYFITMAAVVAVLCLSANTSFADFPRVCRLLALEEYLPSEFAHRGRRLVYSEGIVVLTLLAGALLVLLGGITDRLIPLFAIGAFSAFTLSQLGMVAHWLKHREGPWRRSLLFNAVGGTVTGLTLVIIIVSKFLEGAWLILLAVPGLLFLYIGVRRYRFWIEKATEPFDFSRLDTTPLKQMLIIVPFKGLDLVARKALRLAMATSSEVIAVQILSEEVKTQDLRRCWQELVEEPARDAGLRPPELAVVSSPFRDLYEPLVQFVERTTAKYPDHPIAVMIPEVVEKRWYQFLLRHQKAFLHGLLLMRGGPQTVIITAPFYVKNGAPIPRLKGLAAPETSDGSKQIAGLRTQA